MAEPKPKVNMILAYDTLEDLYLKCLARLSDQLSCLETNISFKNLIPILGNKYKVVLNIEGRDRQELLRCGLMPDSVALNNTDNTKKPDSGSDNPETSEKSGD